MIVLSPSLKSPKFSAAYSNLAIILSATSALGVLSAYTSGEVSFNTVLTQGTSPNRSINSIYHQAEKKKPTDRQWAASFWFNTPSPKWLSIIFMRLIYEKSQPPPEVVWVMVWYAYGLNSLSRIVTRPAYQSPYLCEFKLFSLKLVWIVVLVNSS